MNLDQEHSFFDLDDKTALVCLEQQPAQKTVVTHLTELDYKVHLGLFPEDVLLKLATYNYDVVVIDENFKGSAEGENPILHEIMQRSGTLRREHFVVLLSQRFTTNDAMCAFVHSVDQIINFDDIANFKPVLRRGVAQHAEFYKPFQETLKAVQAI